MPSGVYPRTKEHADAIRCGLSQPNVRRKMRESHIGRVMSDDHKEKISCALTGVPKPPCTEATKSKRKEFMLRAWKEGRHKGITGRKHTIETVLKISGANCHFWRGGVTTENEKQRKSYQYKLWRTYVFERDDYTCQSCGCRGGKLCADHIKPFSLFPDLRTDVDNGRTLCHTCHYKTPTYGAKMLAYPKMNLKSQPID